MCTEYVYITKCWNCGVEHGAITTRCEKCDNATRHNQRWGGCGRTHYRDQIQHSACASCETVNKSGHSRR
ncbi:hypothetical protein SMACR_05011 [Sordaria macrospora]|uniref:WGS project CABT00000000 data, contig 2.8 n=2 Tax=Sordaria macrospora TaxID=5147 RepID=F7VUQ7_SORMK|nr:uncharacterized protein SMAC_05011 [Sordaria macrospora k-hell]KAA8636217.1 hypothetical protein SMACR_05011 [Sordaria macrospora]WPJ57447.1 hypothetical protein SMAC4_05011 [Sordaria macrospora]CCC09253.1 unnamed protein product [Sordaria macrospora k-hell]